MAKKYMTSTRADVRDFLDQMKSLLNSEAFDIDRDFVFQETRANDDPMDPYTNANTMLELGYDTTDVVDRLQELTLSDYSETILDNVAEGFHRFFVFRKVIEGREVYIKVRMKERTVLQKKYVFCISFHFARDPMTNFPYR